jgi:hypothetical protein
MFITIFLFFSLSSGAAINPTVNEFNPRQHTPESTPTSARRAIYNEEFSDTEKDAHSSSVEEVSSSALAATPSNISTMADVRRTMGGKSASLVDFDLLSSSLYKGDYFGAEAIINGKSPWTYTAAVTPTHCLCLSKKKFLALIASDVCLY